MSTQEIAPKDLLVSYTKNEFQQAGYSLSDDNLNCKAFDFIAKKSSPTSPPKKIVTKVLLDLDVLRKQASLELQLIANLISGFPLLIGRTSAGKQMDDATLYKRHNISAISLKTLQMYLKAETGQSTPKISRFTHRGGIYVNLSNTRLKQARQELQLKMDLVADKIGVSRHSLYKYEKGMAFPKVSTFHNLTQVLGDELDDSLEVLTTQNVILDDTTLTDFKQPRSQLQKEISGYLEDKIDLIWFKSEPFDGLSTPSTEEPSAQTPPRSEHPVITGISERDEKKNITRIALIQKLSHFLDKRAIWFVEDDQHELLENFDLSKFPSTQFIVLQISDLESMAEEEFLRLLKTDRSTK